MTITARRTVVGRDPGRHRDGLDHQALDRPLSQLAHEQARQKILLVRRCPREQLTQQAQSARRRSERRR